MALCVKVLESSIFFGDVADINLIQNVTLFFVELGPLVEAEQQLIFFISQELIDDPHHGIDFKNIDYFSKSSLFIYINESVCIKSESGIFEIFLCHICEGSGTHKHNHYVHANQDCAVCHY